MGTGIANIGSSAIGDPIGKAVVEIIADDKAYKEGLKKSEKALSLFDKKTQRIAGKAGKAFLGAGVAIGAALSGVVLHATTAGDELDKLSLRTGVSVENLSRLSFAAQISGADIKTLETSLRFLARRMDESSQGIGIAKEVFEDLGVAITDQDGILRDQPDVLKDVATAIQNLDSDTRQVAAAMDIFGARSGPGLLPLLKQGEEGIQALMDRADELGIVISTKAATASAAFADTLLELTSSFKMASFELGQALLPEVQRAVELFTKGIAEFNKLDEGTKKVIGYGAAMTGLFGIITGTGLLVVSRLDAIVKGFAALKVVTVGGGLALAGATFAALASSLFAFKEIMEEVIDDTDILEGSIRGLKITGEGTHAAIKEIEDALRLQAKLGLDPNILKVGELGIRLDKLNEKLSDGGGAVDTFFRALTLTEEPIGGLILPTTNAAKALEVLQKRLSDSADEGSRLKKEIEGIAGLFSRGTGKDVAGAATDIQDFQIAITNLLNTLRKSITFEPSEMFKTKQMRKEQEEAARDFTKFIKREKEQSKELADALEEQSEAETKLLAPISIQSAFGIIDALQEGYARDSRRFTELQEFKTKLFTEFIKRVKAEDEKDTARAKQELKKKLDLIDEEAKAALAGMGAFNAASEALAIKEINREIEVQNKKLDAKRDADVAVFEAEQEGIKKIAKKVDASRKERKKKDEKAQKDSLKEQKKTAEEWVRIWDKATGDIRFATEDLLISLFEQEDEKRTSNTRKEITKITDAIDELETAQDAGVKTMSLYALGMENFEDAARPIEGLLLDLQKELADLMDEADNQLTRWERFWNDLVSIARKKIAELLVDKAFLAIASLIELWLENLQDAPSGSTKPDIKQAEIIEPPPILAFLPPVKKNAEGDLEFARTVPGVNVTAITPPSPIGIIRGPALVPVSAGRGGATRSIQERQAAALGVSDNFVRIDQLVLNMPSTINQMSQAELDRNTTRQVDSIVRAFDRRPAARRRLRR